jgi:hypothetical protein
MSRSPAATASLGEAVLAAVRALEGGVGLDVRASAINEEMKLAAARAIASVIRTKSYTRSASSPASFTPTWPKRSPRRRCVPAWRASFAHPPE